MIHYDEDYLLSKAYRRTGQLNLLTMAAALVISWLVMLIGG